MTITQKCTGSVKIREDLRWETVWSLLSRRASNSRYIPAHRKKIGASRCSNTLRTRIAPVNSVVVEPVTEVSKVVKERPKIPQSTEYYELLGAYDAEKIGKFFAKKPWEVAGRFATFAKVASRVAKIWRDEEDIPAELRTRGAVLREAISDLGPVFVKCGQTLAQRSDLVGSEVAKCLGKLQSGNRPFDDDIAFQIILEDLDWSGPLSPSLDPFGTGGQPLFQDFESKPVASASLGQVYKALTWEGQEVAVKVQRPNLLPQITKDIYVLRLGLILIRMIWGVTSDLAPIADEVGAGVFQELDYHQEAENAEEFTKAHAFLGFVSAPQWLPEYTGPKGTARVLTTAWIHGKQISELPRSKQIFMVRMAIEASVAQLIRTGIVHADPHEGNLLLSSEGELVYLDFGLICKVEPYLMESFASGICHFLAGKWIELCQDFQEIGFLPNYLVRFENGNTIPCDLETIATSIKQTMENEAGGMSRFGALATGLSQLSSDYRFLCPPFVVLLCRTFLTLEGIADKVDPKFNIYQAALPYALRRALSPETEKGRKVLRDTLLDSNGQFRWMRFNQLMDAASMGKEEKDASAPPIQDPRDDEPADNSSFGFSEVGRILGSPEGSTLRRVVSDANTFALVRYLNSNSASPLRQMGQHFVEQNLRSWASRNIFADDPSDHLGAEGPSCAANKEFPESLGARDKQNALSLLELTEASMAYMEYQQRESRRISKAVKAIAWSHWRRLIYGGIPGAVHVLILAFAVFRIAVRALFSVVSTYITDLWEKTGKPSLSSIKKGRNQKTKPTLGVGFAS